MSRFSTRAAQDAHVIPSIEIDLEATVVGEPGCHSVTRPTIPRVYFDMLERGYTSDKDAYLKRLRRIEGQIRGLQRMVEDDKYCIDVLTQVSAATRALQSVALGLLDDHLRHCVAGAVASGDEGESARLLDEATGAIERLVKA